MVITVIALEGGLVVDETFYNSNFEYWNGLVPYQFLAPAYQNQFTNYEYEVQQNEKKREIFVLKPVVLKKIYLEFKTRVLYSESSEFISKRLKKVAV